MTPEQIEQFLEAARAKYDKGQAEHGGLITDRDLKQEQLNELIDLGHYYFASDYERSSSLLTPDKIKNHSLGNMLCVFCDPEKQLTYWEKAWRTLVELTLNDK